MIEVTVDSVRVNLMSPQRLVILREKGANRYLPIWVGQYEAEAITVALQEVEMVRPLTHDLLRNVFQSLHARLKRIEISALKEDIFYGTIVAELDGAELTVDARPSDSIALAVRAHVPIFVEESVMQNAAILPAAEGQEVSSAREDQGIAPSAESSKERLSVFEDFLGNLNLDRLGGENENPPDDKDSDDEPRQSKPKGSGSK